MKTPVQLLIALCLIAGSQPAAAHRASDSYLTIFDSHSALAARWDIALRDLEKLIGLDLDRDRAITWGELRGKRDALSELVTANLKIRADGATCVPKLQHLRVDRHDGAAYAVLDLDLGCAANPSSIDLEYRLLFAIDPTHRGLVTLREAGASQTRIASPDTPSLVFAPGAGQSVAGFSSFLREGIQHAWGGFDHLLFLFVLLLPAVLVERAGRWEPAARLGTALGSVFKLVTSFTVAHSLTLWCAATGIVPASARWIEPAIALSILVMALRNLFPALGLSGATVAFACGLIHGFGFASVLTHVALTGAPLVLALFGFNIGVELAQLVLVVAFVPLAYAIREQPVYREGVLRFGSVLACVVASLWLFERVAGMEIFHR